MPDNPPMCNRFVPPVQDVIEAHWGLEPSAQPAWPASIHPRSPGPFIRAKDGGRELVVGQWALIPHFAKAATLPFSTNNARSEELTQKTSYRDPWKRGQRCVIPAMSFDEPNWETGKNVWWRFRRADGTSWGLAGIWNTWIDRATGEVVESYSMLTLNADDHPLMRRMHKPDPAHGPDAQDKRSVIPIEIGDVDAWLHGSVEGASRLLQLASVKVFSAAPITANLSQGRLPGRHVGREP